MDDAQVRSFLSYKTQSLILSATSHLFVSSSSKMARSERVRSNFRSRTRSLRRQRNQTSPRDTATSNTELPWDQQRKCINPEERKRLVENQTHDQTGYVYHLWHGIVTEHCPDGAKDLARTYASPELAKHDALCWLIDRQNRIGASTEDYWTHVEYEEEHERCCYYCTDTLVYEELRMSYYAWTTAERIC